MIGETDEHGGWCYGCESVMCTARGEREAECATPGEVNVIAHNGVVAVSVLGAYPDGIGGVSVSVLLSPEAAHELALQILARCARGDA